jgi:glucose/arabinose dehydrogenase
MHKSSDESLIYFVNMDIHVIFVFISTVLCLSTVALPYAVTVYGEKQEEKREELKEQNGDITRESKKLENNIWEGKDIHSESVKSTKLNIELVADGLEFPTTIAFVGPDDILVLEKDRGTVRRIINSTMLAEPVLNVNVNTNKEVCMCGITSKKISSHTYVFLYFTEVESKVEKNSNVDERNPLSNRLYRYELIDGILQDAKLLLDLPKSAGPHHSGGAVTVGPDGNIYLPVGDFDNIRNKQYIETKAQNIEDSKTPDGRGGILRVTQDGNTVGNGILGNSHPLDKYYAYGIRNSFGIDFDPITGNLWDTENGPAYGDEINLVRPGFNSGWFKIQGIWEPVGANDSENILELLQSKILLPSDVDIFVSFNGKGTYSPPEFTWNKTVGPTALKFLTTDKLGQEYKNDLFVGDVNNGIIYHFDLNKDRTQLVLTGKLSDKIADTSAEIDESNIIFGQGFEGITDIEVGPYDGYLYVLSYRDGAIYRIVNSTEEQTSSRISFPQ